MRLGHGVASTKKFERLISERLGADRTFAGLTNVCVDGDGWLCALASKNHISQYEIEPITLSETVRHLSTAGKLVAISSKFSSSQASCYLRSCKVTRASDMNLPSVANEFMVRAKLSPRQTRRSKTVSVTTRLEDMQGELIFIAVFEFEIVSELPSSYLADSYLVNSSQLFVFYKSSHSKAEKQFHYDNDNIFDVHLTNTTGEGKIKLRLDGLQENCIYSLRCYPASFVIAGLVTLSSRMSAGRRGKRFYHYAVKYAEITNYIKGNIEEDLLLECIHLERANNVDVIQCQALLYGEPLLYMELGLVTSG